MFALCVLSHESLTRPLKVSQVSLQENLWGLKHSKMRHLFCLLQQLEVEVKIDAAATGAICSRGVAVSYSHWFPLALSLGSAHSYHLSPTVPLRYQPQSHCCLNYAPESLFGLNLQRAHEAGESYQKVSQQLLTIPLLLVIHSWIGPREIKFTLVSKPKTSHWR